MPAERLSIRDARKLFLQSQGLLRKNQFGRGKNATAEAIRQLGYVQIDTISVVNRAHEHVLQTRVPNFEPRHLDRLMKERSLFEYWSHAAAFMPFEHYRYYLPVMQGWGATRQVDRKLAEAIVDRIRTEGPMQSRHFEEPQKRQSGGWWDWKPAKQALEHLFLAGELMVSHRDGFQKVYDLPERVLPADVQTTIPGVSDWAEFIVMNQLRALGVATEQDLGYARSTIQRLAKIQLKEPIREAVQRLISEDRVIEVSVNGQPMYSTHSALSQLPLRVSRSEAIVLSPFDNLVINRARLKQLFNFDYQLECYLPAGKRRFGYFVLPILLGDQMIGRMDAKADRKAGEMIIRNLVLEDAVDPGAIAEAMHKGLQTFSRQNLCTHYRIERAAPDSLSELLQIHD